MLSSIVFAGALPIVALAVPMLEFTPKARLPDTMWPRRTNASTGDSCDISTLQQPPNTLTPPTTVDPNLELILIALGHGTQNYTCASTTAAPAAIGAVAQLFNASCAVASGSTSTAALGTITEDAASIGAHFFVDTTTPDFDIIGLGNTQAKKVESMAAPQATDVPWLRLEAKAQQASPVKQVYRLNTVGGVAPKTCEGVDGSVEVDYEAQYWIYADRDAVAARRRSLYL